MYGNDCMNIEKLLSNDLSILSLLFSAYMFEANLANRGLSAEAILAIFLAMSWYNSELFWQVQIGNLLNATISRQGYDVVRRSCTKNSLRAKWLEGRNMEQLTSNNIQNYLNYGGWCLFLQYSKYRPLETAWADLWNFSPTLLSSRATMSLVSVSLKGFSNLAPFLQGGNGKLSKARNTDASDGYSIQ